MEFTVIQALIEGKTLSALAETMGLSPNDMTTMLKKETEYVIKHPRNRDSAIAQTISTRNAFAIRRNPRAWAIAIANATKQSVDTGFKPIQHVFTADSIDEAFDMCLNHNVSKRDAMILVYNTTLRILQADNNE